MKVMPEWNVLFGYLGGLIAWGLLTYAEKIGYHVDEKIADALPYAIAMILAHLSDVLTSALNRSAPEARVPPPLTQSQPAAPTPKISS